MKFLVVDGDPNTTFRISSVLLAEFSNSTCDIAHSDLDAMWKLDFASYTAIVTSYMRSLNGFAIAYKAKRQNPKTIVVITSILQNLDGAAQREGIDFVLPHHRWNEIGQTIQKLINKRN